MKKIYYIVPLILFLGCTSTTEEIIQETAETQEPAARPCIIEYTPSKGWFERCDVYRITGTAEAVNPDRIYNVLYLNPADYHSKYPNGPDLPPAVAAVQRDAYTTFVQAYADAANISPREVPDSICSAISNVAARGSVISWVFVSADKLEFIYEICLPGIASDPVAFFNERAVSDGYSLK